MDLFSSHKLLLPFVLIVASACTPRISHIQPYTGEVGQPVTIHGRCLVGPTLVDFAGTRATEFTRVDGSVEASVPEGASTGPVRVRLDNRDLVCRSGIAESPQEFTVITDIVTESESNNSRDTADRFAGNAVTGTLTANDEDWFRLDTGPSGPYGYTLELHAGLRDPVPGAAYRIWVSDESGQGIGYLYSERGAADDDITRLYTIRAPEQTLYLSVHPVDPESGTWQTTEYQIVLSRLPVDDPGEPGDNAPPGSVALVSDEPYSGAHLCSVEHADDARDHYSIELDAPPQVAIAVSDVGLFPDDVVGIHLLKPDGTNYVGGETNPTGGLLVVDLAADYADPNGPPFPAGTWYVLVRNHSPDWFPSTGSGYAPVSCKSRYTIAAAW